MNTVQKRSIGTSILLSIFTCGIYGIFWLYSIINDVCDLKGIDRTAGKDILLTILTCGIYGYFVMYKIGAGIDDIRHSRGLNAGSNGILYLVLHLFGLGIVAFAMAQHSINELC